MRFLLLQGIFSVYPFCLVFHFFYTSASVIGFMAYQISLFPDSTSIKLSRPFVAASENTCGASQASLNATFILGTFIAYPGKANSDAR